jgi:hypothetical protein
MSACLRTHIKSMVVLPSSAAFATGGGMHHVYANATAMGGFSSGHFADGSVLVFDLLRAAENSGVIAADERERLDVMVSSARSCDSRARAIRTVVSEGYGKMFRLRWKILSGSYRCLSAERRE